MKILLQTTDDEFIYLAGDGRISERVFSSVSEFELGAELEKQIVREVRGSHARAISRGNVSHRAYFRARRLLATPQEAEHYATAAERNFPREGVLYFITPAGTRKLRGAVISPPTVNVRGCEVRLRYQATGREFTLSEPELVIDGASGLLYRIVTDSAEQRWEVGFDSPTLLDGNAVDGWTDATGNLRVRLYRSEDLVTWDNDWVACPTSPETTDDGYRYWARARFPQESVVKTGALTVNNDGGDTRNNGFTSLVIAGVAQDLANFPYDMTVAGKSAQLQTDLRALGWTGAICSGTTALDWVISIPTVNYTSYAQTSFVGFPGYDVEDPLGGTSTISQISFSGNYVNNSGVRTAVRKQFARAAVEPGPNYRF